MSKKDELRGKIIGKSAMRNKHLKFLDLFGISILNEIRRFYRRVVPDPPQSAMFRPSFYSFPTQGAHLHAADLDAVLKAAKINEPVTLVTHSMGGNIASAYYLRNPTRVSKIIYTATYYDGKSAKQFFPYEGLTAGVDELSKCVDFYTIMGLDRSIALEAAKWPAHGRRNNASCLVSYDIGDGYNRITVPTLIIYGEDDRTVPVEQGVQPNGRQYAKFPAGASQERGPLFLSDRGTRRNGEID
ncbi:alpha/beta fold hydrolase [Aspergillus novofumigatus IBT 16806]|uniref:Alpha/beta-hydrolase n=1 Tax=Aspergillus novofumigatus (strain IBT 16806) TaxID=1392255 RepID=A0A2I1BSA3_ASPN1|nr:alpha/beta-hydrolase [Aspergillus novofumigatus IBT 16806]PKX88204.1 alpha/beta-hydrolase [Aspergillus novofumigatus IBT 16806]